jgi:RNA recognition motif-containing protein
VLFGYQLPDTGADAWGGSSSSAALESTPGSGCISQEPSNKLFVGNIGWWVTEDDLLHWFSRFGTVMHVKVRRC